eukprot:TRINITY_DN16468_c0_g1_i5.p1 TRINITY_DN16468_c0_g1~~TRINITY_DN16468_c0_g1_i5.p1  ORF type:complete len:300 (-),score=23.26 TRINITY_DN16468_c0_g1_i5:1257-2075(-)
MSTNNQGNSQPQNEETNEDNTQNRKRLFGVSTRRFFVFGPFPATQFCGANLRLASFIAAVIQALIGVGFTILCFFVIWSMSFDLVVGVLVASGLLLLAGVNGFRCTLQQVVKDGLNERLVERLIVWNWLSGMVTLLSFLSIIVNLVQFNIMYVGSGVLITPVYGLCAFVVWSYKEESMAKLPAYVGSWTKRNIPLDGDNSPKEMKPEVSTFQTGDASGGEMISAYGQPAWGPSGNNNTENERNMLLDDDYNKKPTWQPLDPKAHGAYDQSVV